MKMPSSGRKIKLLRSCCPSSHQGSYRQIPGLEDMGSDLSYAVAMLDSHNNGVVLSSIFAREDSRSYAKPIVNGTSTYPMTSEEEDASDKHG